MYFPTLLLSGVWHYAMAPHGDVYTGVLYGENVEIVLKWGLGEKLGSCPPPANCPPPVWEILKSCICQCFSFLPVHLTHPLPTHHKVRLGSMRDCYLP
jgi:hypothetical protein